MATYSGILAWEIPWMELEPEEILKFSVRLDSQMARGICPQWMKETQIQSLGWEYPLEEGMATQSSILACGIPWTEELGRLQSMGSQRVRHH